MEKQLQPAKSLKTDTQTVRLADFLLRGKKIHCKSQDRRDMEIGYLPSRISDLRNKFGLKDLIEGEPLKVGANNNGSNQPCAVYCIPPHKIPEARLVLKNSHRVFYKKILSISA